jgi:hypothetical protein
MSKKMNNVMRWMLGIGLVLGTGTGYADTKAATTTPGVPDAAMMEKMQKYMTPGAEHAMLEPMVGKWNAKVKMWMQPGAKAEESVGSAENSWALNKHFLKQDFKGTWNNQPFEGTGYTGYDKVREEYQSVWLDSMGTGIMYSNGTYDAAKKVINQSGTYSCPMTGDKNMWSRSEVKMSGNDKFSYTSYGKGPDGKEFKSMEIVYTRAK